MADSFIVARNRDGKPKRGEALRWLDEIAVPFRGDNCLPFPFHRAASGHGRLAGRNGPALAHVYVLEKTVGPKPSPAHEGCHECGRGHAGCVNPSHLYWGTRSENMADRKVHGVAVPPPVHRGTTNVRNVLSEAQVWAIRKRISEGVYLHDIAAEFGVSKGAVSGIKYGHTWAWLT